MTTAKNVTRSAGSLRKLTAISLALSLRAACLPAGAFAEIPSDCPTAAVYALTPEPACAAAALIPPDRLAAIAEGVPLRKEELAPLNGLLAGLPGDKPGPEDFFQLNADGKTSVSPPGRELLLARLRTCFAGAPVTDAAEARDAERASQSRTDGILRRLTSALGGFGGKELDGAFDTGAPRPGSPEPVELSLAGSPGAAAGLPAAKPVSKFKHAPAILPTAVLVPYAGQASGLTTWLHEQSHIWAAKLFQNPEKIGVHIDAFDNIKNLISDPSWENLKRVLVRYDVDQDGFGGYMWTDQNRPTGLGTALGEQRSDALVTAAGSLGQDLPALGGYAAGYALRKKNPVAGYTLMLTSAIHHVITALYPWQAAVLPARGGDWVRLAAYSGIHPAVTALAFTAILPAEALALSAAERMLERSRDEKLALYNIIGKGTLDEDALRALFDGYSRKGALSVPEGMNISDLLKRPPEQILVKPEAKLVKEIRLFQSYVIKRNKDLIEAERKLLPRLDKSAFRLMLDYFNERCKTDKAGAILEAGTMATSLAAGMSGLAAVADWAGREAAGNALKYLVPLLGVFTIVSAGNKIRRVLGDKTLDRNQKLLKIAQHAGGIVASGSLLNPAAAPVLLPAGLAVTLAALAAEWLYNRHAAGGTVSGV